MKYDPELDGVDHVNIYSNGKTELGRLLSNFSYAPFEHPMYGHFYSIEGLWYWYSVLSDEPRREELRYAYGYEAKKLGRALRGQDWDGHPAHFRQTIKMALECKYKNDPHLQALLHANHLPLVHYYVYNVGGKVVVPKEGKWLMDFWRERAVSRGQ